MGGLFMAPNFKIATQRSSDNLHLKLTGDFDGASAHELLYMLKQNRHKAQRIFIHTGSLRKIHPFGRNVFHKNLGGTNRNSNQILFTGENASQIATENSDYLK
jgi:hypothetical protein